MWLIYWGLLVLDQLLLDGCLLLWTVGYSQAVIRPLRHLPSRIDTHVYLEYLNSA